MDPEEAVVRMVLPGDYSGALLFFFENGKAARVDLTAYATTSNRRRLTGAYSDKSPLAALLHLKEDPSGRYSNLSCSPSSSRSRAPAAGMVRQRYRGRLVRAVSSTAAASVRRCLALRVITCTPWVDRVALGERRAVLKMRTRLSEENRASSRSSFRCSSAARGLLSL